MRKPLLIILLLICSVICIVNFCWAGDPGDTNYYRGTIGKYTVTMKLVINDGDIIGQYIYDDKGIKIDIKGKKIEHDIEMREFYNGQNTGLFIGRYDPQAKKITGNWRKSKDSRPLSFKLAAVRVSASIFPNVTLSNPSNNEALQLFLVKNMIEKYGPEANDANEITYETLYQSEGLVSILFTYKYEGGVHPNTGYGSLNISLTDGRASKIDLESLFKENSNYLQIISKLCIDDLKRQNAELYKHELSERDLAVFNLSSDSIKFSFAPYIVGSYAAGSYFVTIPYKGIDKILDPNGPLGSFVKNQMK